jgi:hypothetical protein
VKFRIRAWQLSALVVVVCLALWGLAEWARRRGDTTDEALYRRLPADNATQVYVNVKSLRQAGLLDLLAGSKAAEELDYQKFVEQTSFDYREDLDVVLGAFYSGRSLFLLRGRFDWERIRQWAEKQGATCINGYCAMDTSRPNRAVSFYMVFPNVMAVGIAENTYGAYAAQDPRPAPAVPTIPGQPFWVRVPASVLSDPENLPAGTRAFASAVKGAERVTLGVGPGGEAFEAEMQAVFKTEGEAAKMRAQLEEATVTLQRFFARDKQVPNPNDLSGMLVAGRFEQQGSRLTGKWPIRWEFLTALAQGKM